MFDEDLEEDLPDSISPEDAAVAQKGAAFAQHYLVDAEGLLASAKLQPDWLVEGAIPSGGVTFLVGRPGSSKSWLAYDLVVATVQRRPWLKFGVPNAAGSPTAMVLNFDNPGSECARRFLRLGLRPTDHALFHSLGAHRPPEGLPQILQLPLAFEPLDAMVQAYRPDVIIIDSLRQAFQGDESSSQEMAVVMSQARRLAGYGGAVVIVHHTRKNDGSMRGSTEIEAAADAIIDVDANVATWRKTRGWDMAINSVVFKLEDDGEATELKGGMTLVDSLSDSAGKTPKAISEDLGLSLPATKAMLEKAESKGLVEQRRGHMGDRLWVLARRNEDV